MNFTRWSPRLPGTQRRSAAAQAQRTQRRTQRVERTERAERERRAQRTERADRVELSERSEGSESLGTFEGSELTKTKTSAKAKQPEQSEPQERPATAGRPAEAPADAATTAPGRTDQESRDQDQESRDQGSRDQGPADQGRADEPQPDHGRPGPGSGLLPTTRVDRFEPPPTSANGDRHRIDLAAVHDLLGRVPAPVAVVHGPDHRIAYVNAAYANLFGHPPMGASARVALPELIELGLLPLMDQVLRSRRSRTVKSRRVASASRRDYYTFTCAPIEVGPGHENDPDQDHDYGPAWRRGVLVFGSDVTDQVEIAERLRASEREQREAAVTLQRSLLPQELEQPDDLRVAATYQPGGKDAAVGGDWYDVITLGAGRTALVIGDVMGHGLRAAAVMGQLRTAVRAYARLDLPPHEVLQLLDGLAAEIDASQIATCVYAVHDPNEGTLCYASAGHLPMLVREPDGTVRRAAEPTGPPLGTGGWLHTSGTVPLVPGSTAVLYTDGLVERRDADIDDGVAALERAFAGATGTAQVIVDRLLRALRISDDHNDDVAALVVQHPVRTGHEAELFHNAALELLGGVEAAPRARAFASGVLTSWRFPAELHDLGVLATSELVANSLQHGTPPMRLRLRRTDRRLIIEVTDGDDRLPRRRRAEPGDETGRGISIIATIASSWGSRRTPGGGKAVWCEFALPPGQ